MPPLQAPENICPLLLISRQEYRPGEYRKDILRVGFRKGCVTDTPEIGDQIRKMGGYGSDTVRGHSEDEQREGCKHR